MESQRVLSDRYALITHLARGGMADVWVAEDRLLGRRVAVKILHGEFANSEAFVERFRREAQAAAGLTHPNIVAIHDWGEDAGTYFMVMELVQGRNLRDVLRSEGALLPRRVAEIGVEVATALAVAHDQGISHRDVKQANVLLASDGTVKVADFGIARAWDDSEQLTRTGAVIGTATYFSPEQAQGGTADARSDIYSLGVVMYELLVGTPPFSGESPVAVAYQHVQEAPTPPSQLNPNIPPGLEAVVLKAMEKDPLDRYQSAAELIDDLHRLLAGQVPLAAPQNEAPTRVVAAATPRSTGEQAYQAATAAVPAGTAATPYTPEYVDPGRPDRSTTVIGILAALALLGLGLIVLVRLLAPGDSAGTVTIPNVIGNDPIEAIEELQNLELTVVQQTVVDDTVAVGRVAGTDPPIGTEVDTGSTVALLISAGEATVSVPRVIDAAESQARTLIESSGLEVGDVTAEVSDTIAVGNVISQSPGPGDLVATGSEVDLVISAGTSAIAVPGVSGSTESDALFQLSQAGFTAAQVRVERRPSADVIEGFVIGTEPESGQLVPEGGIVTLIISEGAVPTVVPSVVGIPAEEAQAFLEELGFVVEYTEPEELEFQDPDDGNITVQDPEAGVTLEFGETVTLTIGVAPEVLTPPDVIGLEIGEARDVIEDAGFVFAQGDDVDVDFGDPNDGRVAAQTPGPDDEVEEGSTITVSLGVAPPPTSVPNVSSPCLPQNDAQALIEAAGLVMVIGPPVSLPLGDACDGNVVQQAPQADSEVGEGTEVIVNIGSSPAAITLPSEADVYGKRLATIRNEVPEVQWSLAPERCIVVEDASLSGRIALIDPAPGSVVEEGSTVTVWLGRLAEEACE